MSVFIDAANLERSVQDMWVNPKDIHDDLRKYMAEQLCWRVDYQKLKAFFQSLSTLQEIRFYSARFNSEPHDKFLSFLRKALQFKLETKSLKEYKDHTKDHPHRKANFDVEIAVDATYRLSDYDTDIADFRFDILRIALKHAKNPAL